MKNSTQNKFDLAPMLLKKTLLHRNIAPLWLGTHQIDVNHWVLPKPFIIRLHSIRKKIIRRYLAFHKIQVTSYGGAGTTTLCKYLSACNAGLPQISDGDWSPWKHMSRPPADRTVRENFRAIYLISHPGEALLSVFRRGLQHWHIQRMDGDLTNWDFSWNLDDFLMVKSDLFGFYSQFMGWTESKRNYPILIIKYECLWDHIPEFVDFSGLPSRYESDFPTKIPRASKFENQSFRIQDSIKSIFRELFEDFESFPDWQIKEPEA
jgi:hypothetical protein